MNVEARASVVLVGHGYWGKNIARNLNDLGSLYGVYEINKTERAQIKELYPDVKLFDTFEEVLIDEDVAGVALSTPAETHAQLSIKAMRAGKDVYVEKPLALNYIDGLQMIDAAERFNRVLMVGHLLEYHPGVIALTDLVRSGEMGKLQYIYSNRLNLGKFRREENILWSFAPHDIAIILRLVGEVPIEVLAAGGTYLQPNIADTTVTNLLFDNGVRAHIFVSWLHPYKEQRLVVIGSNKMAVFDDRAEPGQKLVLYDQGADWVDNLPVPRISRGTPVIYPAAEPLREEMRHFIECVVNRCVPVTDGHNGLRVLQVLQAAQQSLQTGGSRVPLFQPVRSVAVL
jgi:predicted dehydrogenase